MPILNVWRVHDVANMTEFRRFPPKAPTLSGIFQRYNRCSIFYDPSIIYTSTKYNKTIVYLWTISTSFLWRPFFIATMHTHVDGSILQCTRWL